ncbi:hypothetical protein [Enterobacter hormaechei]|nr:hypothetical protein [Enterobacter hormaechei]
MNYITFAVLFASVTLRKNGRFITLENISLSAGLVPQRRVGVGMCAREQVNTRPMQGMRRVSRFTEKWKRYLSGIAKNNVVASDYE